VMALGKATYQRTCITCHWIDGKGLPLGADKKMAPPLVQSPYVQGDPSLFALIVLKGVARVDEKWFGTMLPLEMQLDEKTKTIDLNEKQLAAVMTYVRNSFGNKAPEITEADVKAARAKYSKITMPIQRTTMEKLLEKSKKTAEAEKAAEKAAGEAKEKAAAVEAPAAKAPAATQ